jgi:hypothetical protein
MGRILSVPVLVLLLATLISAQGAPAGRLQLLNETLSPYGVGVLDAGYTSDGVAFIKYEQRPTSSPANVHASQIMALSVIADEYPNSTVSMSIAFAGGKPIQVVYAKTSDMNAFSSGNMSAAEFSGKVYTKILVPSPASASKPGTCSSAFVLLALLSGAFIANSGCVRRAF